MALSVERVLMIILLGHSMEKIYILVIPMIVSLNGLIMKSLLRMYSLEIR